MLWKLKSFDLTTLNSSLMPLTHPCPGTSHGLLYASHHQSTSVPAALLLHTLSKWLVHPHSLQFFQMFNICQGHALCCSICILRWLVVVFFMGYLCYQYSVLSTLQYQNIWFLLLCQVLLFALSTFLLFWSNITSDYM